MDKKKKNIVRFFLLAFLFIRVADVHAYSHFYDDNDDQVHCELCEIITVSNEFTPILNGSLIEEIKLELNGFQITETDFCYETPYYCVTLPLLVQNKPPPKV